MIFSTFSIGKAKGRLMIFSRGWVEIIELLRTREHVDFPPPLGNLYREFGQFLLKHDQPGGGGGIKVETEFGKCVCKIWIFFKSSF